MKYHHIVKKWNLNEKKNVILSFNNKAVLLKFDSLLIFGQGSTIYIIDEKC
jgi:hypothetical protein